MESTMLILICTVGILFAFIGFRKYKALFNPLTIFCGLWVMISFFSYIHTKLTTPTEFTYSIIFYGILSYGIGYCISLIVPKHRYKLRKELVPYNKIEYIPRYTLLYVASVICILAFLFDFVQLLRSISSFNLGQLQKYLQSGEYVRSGSSLVNALYLLIIYPVSYAIPIVAATDFWYGRRDRKLLLLTVGMLLIKTVTTSTRMTLILFIIYIIITALLNIKYKERLVDSVKKTAKKQRKIIIMLLIVAIIIFAVLSISRGLNVLMNAYTDFAIEPRMMEIWIEEVDSSQIMGYGIASLLGFIYAFFYLLKNIFGFQIPSLVLQIYNLTRLTDTKWVWPGKNVIANAYVSIFWFLYLDGRMMGVVLGMFLFARFMESTYYRALRAQNQKSVAIYCLAFNVMLFSYIRMQMTQTTFALAFIFIIFFAYKRKVKSDDVGID